MERVMGIEPTSTAWKAEVLPLNYTRRPREITSIHHKKRNTPMALSIVIACPSLYFPNMVEGGGFEPPKAEPSDLQSDPFGHSGTPPFCKPGILHLLPKNVNQRDQKSSSHHCNCARSSILKFVEKKTIHFLCSQTTAITTDASRS
jgi:hypothetical protein